MGTKTHLRSLLELSPVFIFVVFVGGTNFPARRFSSMTSLSLQSIGVAHKGKDILVGIKTTCLMHAVRSYRMHGQT